MIEVDFHNLFSVPVTTSAPVNLPVPGDCTFSDDLCGYTNVKTADFNWRRTDQSPTDFTGPDKDHTVNGKKTANFNGGLITM